MMNTLAKLRLIRDKDAQINKLKSKLSRVKSRLLAEIDAIETVENEKFIGQWALFSWDGKKYTCQGVYDENSEDIADDVMEDTALIMALPDHESLNEFDGF